MILQFQLLKLETKNISKKINIFFYQTNQTWIGTEVMDIVRPVNSPRRKNSRKGFVEISLSSDCEEFCSVNAGCVAWTLATKTNVDIPSQCVLYSAVGARVPYPNCISGKVFSIIMKYFLLFPYSDVRSYTCQEFSEKDCGTKRGSLRVL